MPTADELLELAALQFNQQHYAQALETLRQAQQVPFEVIPRANLMTALGWYVNAVTGDLTEPRVLGEQSIALTQTEEGMEGLAATADAMALVSYCCWLDDPARAEQLAGASSAILDRVLDAGVLPESLDRCELLLQSAQVDASLRRCDQAASRCEEALQATTKSEQAIRALSTLGATYRNAGRLTEAQQTFQKVLAFPNVIPITRVNLYDELAQTEEAMGKTAEARAKVSKAIDLVQSDPSLPRYRLAELHRSHGYLSYALEDLAVAAKSFQSSMDSYSPTDPFGWNSLLWLASCQYELGQLHLARRNATLVSQSKFASDEDRTGAGDLLQDLDQLTS